MGRLRVIQLMVFALTIGASISIRAQTWLSTDFKIVHRQPITDGYYDEWRKGVRATLSNVRQAYYESLGTADAELAAQKALADEAWAGLIESMLKEIAITFRDAGYPGPRNMPLMTDEDGRRKYEVFLYNFDNTLFHKKHAAGIASSMDCGQEVSWIAINESSFEFQRQAQLTPAELDALAALEMPATGSRDLSELSNSERQALRIRALQNYRGEVLHQLYATLAHELFHTIQFSWDAQYRSVHLCGGDMHRVQVEGTAEAVGNYTVERRYPGFIRRSQDKTVRGEWTYNYPFIDADMSTPGDTLPDLAPYYTSSFWRYLMERYNGYSVMKELFARNLEIPVSHTTVLRWLDNGLRENSAIRQPLYLVFPDFAGNLTTWGQDVFDIPDEGWQWPVMNKCIQVELSQAKPTVNRELELGTAAAKCMTVSVKGLAPDQNAQVKFMATDTNVSDLDGLHLAAARLLGSVKPENDSFNCYVAGRAAADSGSPWPACLQKPFMGQRGQAAKQQLEAEEQRDYEDRVGDGGLVAATTGGRYAKVWLSPFQSGSQGEFTNTYTFSNVPVDPVFEIDPTKFRLTVSLGVASLKTSEHGENKNPDANVGRPKEPEPVPMQGSEQGAVGPAGLTPDDVSQMAFLQNLRITDLMWNELGEEITAIHLSTADPSLPDAAAEGATLFSVAMEQPLRLGVTGVFPAAISIGSFDLATGMMLLPDDLNAPTGQITIKRFDDAILEIGLKVRYCRLSDMDFDARRCLNSHSLEASMIKPFGWTYDMNQPFVSINTPGMQLYRDMLRDSLFGSDVQNLEESRQPMDSPIAGVGPAAPGGLPGKDGGAGIGSGASQCACTCAELAEFEAIGEELDARSEAAGTGMPDMQGIDLGRMMCQITCAEQFIACEVD